MTEGRWIETEHLRFLDRKLLQLIAGDRGRLIVQAPPRHGKSMLCSVFLPAWYLGRNPEKEVILASATDELAGDFSASCRDILQEHGKRLFGLKIRKDTSARHRWKLPQGGGLRAAGVGGDIMGRGADLLIIDDYLKNHEEAHSERRRKNIHQWFNAVSGTRLSPGGKIVIIATRWHKDDLIGQLLHEETRGGDAWDVVRLPALAEEENDPLGRVAGEPLWPERFNADWLRRRREKFSAGGTAWVWEALYQQNPPAAIDAEWPASYFGESIWYRDPPPREEQSWRIMALDPSLGKDDRADYSAFVMLTADREGRMWIEADVARRDAGRIVEEGMTHLRRFQPDAFGVEGTQFQELLGGMFLEAGRESGTTLPLYSLNQTRNKLSRIRSLSPYLSRGAFKFAADSPGTTLLVDQLRAFPHGKHDDGPDALEMAVRLLRYLQEGKAENDRESEPEA